MNSETKNAKIFVFSDNPETKEKCANLPVQVLEYKPTVGSSTIIPKIIELFGGSSTASADRVTVEKMLEEIYKQAKANPAQTFNLVFDVYGLQDLKNNIVYWDDLKAKPNIKIDYFSLSEKKQNSEIHSLDAILNELCAEYISKQTADESEKDQESDKQASCRKTQTPENNQVNAALLQNFVEALKKINAKVDALSQNMETVKTIVSKKSNIDETNLQLRQELTEKVQHASAEMSKAKRSEKQWVQSISSFLDSLAAEASNPDLSEDMRYMAERYSKTLLRYLEPLQFEKIELTVGDNCNPCSEIQVRYSETETAPQEEPLKILEIQEYGYKYQGVVVKPAKVIVPQPVQTTNVKEETIEIVENDVNNKSAEK